MTPEEPTVETAAEAPAPRTAMAVLLDAKHRGRVTVNKAELERLRADGTLDAHGARVEFEQAVIQNDIYVEDR